jgi:hypothetical protein
MIHLSKIRYDGVQRDGSGSASVFIARIKICTGMRLERVGPPMNEQGADDHDAYLILACRFAGQALMEFIGVEILMLVTHTTETESADPC